MKRYNSDYSNLLRPLLVGFQLEESPNQESYELTENVDLSLKDLSISSDDAVLTFIDGRLAGYQLSHLYKNSADEFRTPGTLEFAQSYVLSNFRKKGIGKKMKQFCLKDSLSNSSVVSILAVIREENVPSTNLHLSLGFKRIGEYDTDHTYVAYTVDF